MKTENEDGSTIKSTMRYTFYAPGAIGKRWGRGLRSLITKGKTLTKISLSSFYQPNDLVKQYVKEVETSAIEKGPEEGLTNSTMCSSQVMGTTICKNFMVWENECMPVNTSLTLSTNEVKPYTQEIETSSIGKERGKELINSTMCSSQVMGMTIHKNSMVCENEHMQVDTPFSPSTNQVKQFTKEVEASAIGKGPERGLKNFTMSSSQGIRMIRVIGKGPEGLENFTVSSSQGMGRILKNSMGQENEHMQVHTSFSPLTNQVKQCTKEVETRSSNSKKVKRVRGSNKYKEVASLDIYQNLKDKFESDNMNDHHDHIFEWMNSRVTNGEDTCIDLHLNGY
ncbi:hypothetical protein FXO37_31731 [Capsicum annuum]|nr:hypothetical protein FXO37_31731 [Capsicum annuum]